MEGTKVNTLGTKANRPIKLCKHFPMKSKLSLLLRKKNSLLLKREIEEDLREHLVIGRYKVRAKNKSNT